MVWYIYDMILYVDWHCIYWTALPRLGALVAVAIPHWAAACHRWTRALAVGMWRWLRGLRAWGFLWERMAWVINDDEHIGIWVCLKMGYTPNYSHLVGIMIIIVIVYPQVNSHILPWKDPPCLMEKSTISTGPFSIAFCMFTRGYWYILVIW